MSVTESEQQEDVEYARREAAEKADEYLKTFPGGEFDDEAREVLDSIQPLILETPLKRLAARDAEIKPVFKAQCAEAVKTRRRGRPEVRHQLEQYLRTRF